MMKQVVFWSIVFLPAVIACALALLIAVAAYEVRIIMDAEAYARAGVRFQKLARWLHEMHRPIWQGQSHCILFDEVLFYKPRPGKCEFNGIEYSTLLTFDSRGFRQTSPPMRQNDERPNRGRIIVLGDSQAMGWGVQDEETFASVLAAEHGFEVFNLAVSSYGTARELLRLQKEFELQKGDIVVIQYHHNDLRENLTFLESGGLPRRSPSDLGLLAHTSPGYDVLQVSKSIAFFIVNRLKQPLFTDSSRKSSRKPHAETFLTVIDHFPELAQAKVVVCEVPSYGQTTSFTGDLARLADGTINVLKPVWETSDFYRLDEHMNATGHRKLAHFIAATILSG